MSSKPGETPLRDLCQAIVEYPDDYKVTIEQVRPLAETYLALMAVLKEAGILAALDAQNKEKKTD